MRFGIILEQTILIDGLKAVVIPYVGLFNCFSIDRFGVSFRTAWFEIEPDPLLPNKGEYDFERWKGVEAWPRAEGNPLAEELQPTNSGRRISRIGPEPVRSRPGRELPQS